jgi:hypothetical protein
MESAPRHMIQQQHLHLNFHGGGSVAALSGTLSQWLREQLLPAMEQVLDELDIPSQRLRLNALQINAGEISGPDWEEQLTRSICRELRQLIREAAVWPEPVPAAMQETLPGSTPVYNEEERQELVLHYLQTGTLPWYASGMQASIILQWLEQMVAAGYFSSGQGNRLLREHTAALRRLLMQTSTAALESWLGQWQAASYYQVFPIMLRLAKQVFGASRTSLAWACALFFEHTGAVPAAAAGKPLWWKWLEEKYNMELPAASILLSVTRQLTKQELPVTDWETRFMEQLSALPAKAPAEKETPGTTTTVYYINNAGLVLLHPFLSAFFSQLGLYVEKDWKDDAAQRRAVLLLHYLVTGRQEIAEYELPLCKLLAGYPLNRPVEALLEVTTAEQAECDALLQEVIAQWSILKNTSVEGLQQSFLQRDGKLSRQDNGWLLQVGQQPYDILLDHLPWSTGVIRNSWMQELLFTEWY